MWSSLCNINPCFSFSLPTILVLLSSNAFTATSASSNRLQYQEQIIRIQPIYQLQRATVTSGTAWPFIQPCTLWISQDLLCRTAQQLVCLWARTIIFISCRCWPGHLLLDWSGCWAEIWESAVSSRITSQEHKWKIMGNQECNMLCRKRRYELTTSNSSCCSKYN